MPGGGKMMDAEEFANDGPTYNFRKGGAPARAKAETALDEMKRLAMGGTPPRSGKSAVLGELQRMADEVDRRDHISRGAQKTQFETNVPRGSVVPKIELEGFPFRNSFRVQADSSTGAVQMTFKFEAPNEQQYAITQHVAVEHLARMDQERMVLEFIRIVERMVVEAVHEWVKSCIRVDGHQVFKPDEQPNVEVFVDGESVGEATNVKFDETHPRRQNRHDKKREDRARAKRETEEALKGGDAMGALAKRLGR